MKISAVSNIQLNTKRAISFGYIYKNQNANDDAVVSYGLSSQADSLISAIENLPELLKKTKK